MWLLGFLFDAYLKFAKVLISSILLFIYLFISTLNLSIKNYYWKNIEIFMFNTVFKFQTFRGLISNLNLEVAFLFLFIL